MRYRSARALLFDRMARFLLAIMLCFFAGIASADAAQKVRIGIYQNMPKVGYTDPAKPEGLFIDVIEAIAAREGWSLEYVPGTWSEGLARLEAGQIDLMTDVALTAERKGRFAFHREPVYLGLTEVYVPAGASVRSLRDLKGKRVALLKDSLQQELFEELVQGLSLDVTIVPTADYAEAFQAVVQGRADAVVTNRLYGLLNAAQAGIEDTGIVFNPRHFYYAALLGKNDVLLAAIDRGMLAFKADPDSVYYRSLYRWTRLDAAPRIPAWVVRAAWVVTALLAISVLWSLTLRRTAARLRASERRQRALSNELNNIFRNSLDAICVFDAEYRFVSASAASEKLWGYLPDELSGKSYFDLVPPEDRAALLTTAQKIREDGQTGAIEGRAIRKDGSLVDVLWSAAWSAADQRWYAVAHDDSERKKLRDEAKSRARALEQYAAELVVARNAAQAADRLKSAFLATMSHELRTPLNSIIGFTGIILQGLAGPINAEQKKQLGMVGGSADHLLALINDILDISKIEAGELLIAAERFDLAAAIRQATAVIAPLAAKKGLTLNTHIASSLGEMTGDARRVGQILLNLLANAVKFTDTGSVSLDAEPLADYRRNDAALPCAAVCLRVSDTGIGFNPEDMPLPFTPFHQIDSAADRLHIGTGLGLAISQRLAELMGGTLTVASRLHEGSVFTVTLPLTMDSDKLPA